MAAGLGFKDFTTGEVLTAADVDGYLMQGVWVFASAAARDAAVTSPQEGNFAYLKDTNVTTYYTGSAWANLDTTGMTNPMTTAGDTIYGGASGTPTRLAIGSTGDVLTVSGGNPVWAAPAGGGGFTLLDTKTFDNSVTNYTFTSISGSYKHLYVIGESLQSNATSGTATGFDVNLNSDTAGNYWFSKIRLLSTTLSGVSLDGDTKFTTGNCLNDTNDTAGFGSMEFIIYNYAGTTNYKETLSRVFCSINGASGTTEASWFNGTYNSTNAITSIKFTNTGAVNLKSGTLKLYGVS